MFLQEIEKIYIDSEIANKPQTKPTTKAIMRQVNTIKTDMIKNAKQHIDVTRYENPENVYPATIEYFRHEGISVWFNDLSIAFILPRNERVF